jgi:CheY-like chemotaxis protein
MSTKPLNILVVDDDKNFAHTLCAILKSEGYQCQEVYSVKEAQKILGMEHFDCVLSDVRMPEKSGADFYQEIKDQYPNLPFILMTAYTSSEVIDEAIHSGVLKAIQKPINIQEILGFFAKLSKNLQAAIVCAESDVCSIIQKALQRDRFIFTIYQSIKSLIAAKKKDFSIVFIDSQDFTSHFSRDVQRLLDYLPERTIVIICDYKKAANEKNEETLQDNLNLIILPREKKLSQNISQILEREYYQYAKNSIK